MSAPAYCRLLPVHQPADPQRSTAVFLHGFPDSPQMFAAYHSEAERQQPWLAGRRIYAFEFPNRHTGPGRAPPLNQLVRGRLTEHGSVQREVDEALDQLAADSPTGQLLLVAHDWGATSCWSWIRRHPDPPVEKMVSLSVGSSFRYDLLEHGLNAMAWQYSVLMCLGYYLPLPPVQRLLTWAWTTFAGYRDPDASSLHRDTWHYWYGPFTLLAAPLSLLGLRYRPGFTGFRFPVLYLRCDDDRIASTAAFEQHLSERPDCQMKVLQDACHWFPSQQPERVLPELRAFV